VQFLLTVIIAAFFYAKGEEAARGVRAFFYRLAGRSGEHAAVLAGNSIRGVAMGVVVTALVQTIISGIGLLIVSMPATPLITAAVLVLCLAQIGPFLAIVPAVAWIYYTRGAVWGSALLVFALIAGTIDNFIRPILIRKGADLPLPLILLGVIGGLVGLGVMGIFIGPVILAVTYDLLKEWVFNGLKAEAADAAASRLLPHSDA